MAMRALPVYTSPKLWNRPRIKHKVYLYPRIAKSNTDSQQTKTSMVIPCFLLKKVIAVIL